MSEIDDILATAEAYQPVTQQDPAQNNDIDDILATAEAYQPQRAEPATSDDGDIDSILAQAEAYQATPRPQQPPESAQRFRQQLELDDQNPNKLSNIFRRPDRETYPTVAEATPRPASSGGTISSAEAEAQLDPLQLDGKRGSAFGATARPFAQMGTKFFVKTLRGILQVSAMPARGLSAGAKMVGIDNSITRTIDKVGNKLDSETKIEQELNQDYQDRLVKKLVSGDIGSAAYQVISEGGLDMATGLLQVMMLGSMTAGASGSKAGALVRPGLATTNKAIMSNAAIRGIYSFLTTPGSASEKLKSALTTVAFMSTPAVARNFKMAGLADLTANTTLSTLTGMYKDAWDIATKQAEISGKQESVVPLFVSYALLTFLSDSFSSSGTQYKGVVANRVNAQLKKLPPEQRAQVLDLIKNTDLAMDAQSKQSKIAQGKLLTEFAKQQEQVKEIAKPKTEEAQLADEAARKIEERITAQEKVISEPEVVKAAAPPRQVAVPEVAVKESVATGTKATSFKDMTEPELQRLAGKLGVSIEGGRYKTEQLVESKINKMTVEEFRTTKKNIRFAFEKRAEDVKAFTNAQLIKQQERDVAAGVRVGVAKQKAEEAAKKQQIEEYGKIAKDYIGLLKPDINKNQEKVMVARARSESSLRSVMDSVDKMFVRDKAKETGMDKPIKARIEEATGVRKITDAVITSTMKQLTDQFRIEQQAGKRGAISRGKEMREKAKVKQETNKAIRDLKRYEKLAGPKSASIPQEYKEQINSMLEAIGLKGRPSGEKADRLQKKAESQAEFIRRMEASGEIIPIPPERIIDLSKVNARDMSLEQLKAIRDQVKMMAKIGRDSQIQIGLKGRVKNEVLVRKAVKEIAKFGRIKAEDGDKFSAPKDPTIIEKIKRTIDGLFAYNRKNQFISDFLGKDVYNATTKRIQDAGTKELQMKEVQKVLLLDAIAPYANEKDWRDFTKNKVRIPGTTLEMTRENAVTVALNAGNKGNRERLVVGNGIPEKAIDKIVDTLTAREKTLVKKLQNLASAAWEQSADVAETLSGVRPQKIDGIYWPIAIDRDKAPQAARRQAEQDLMDRVVGQSFVRGGFTQARVGGTDAVDLRGTSVLLKHLNEVAHFNTHAVPVRDVNKIIRDVRFKKAVSDTYNESIYESAFPNWLKSVANPRQDVSNIDRVVNLMRRNSIKATLALKLSVSAMQAGSFSLTVHELGKASANSAASVSTGMKWAMNGLADFYGDPIAMHNKVNQLSTEMRNRSNSIDRDMNEAASSDGMKKLLSDKPGASDLMFSTIRMIDAAVTYPTWLGAYNKEMSISGDQTKAVNYADKVVQKTQPQGAIKDLAEISKGGAFQKLFTQYYTFFSVAYNQIAQTKDFLKLSKAGAGSKVKEVASALTFLLVVPSLYSEWARKGFRRLTPKEMVSSMGSYLAGTLPFVRDLASPYGIQAVPAATGAKRLRAGFRAGVKGAKEGDVINKESIEGLVRGGGQIFGLPTEQGWITAMGLIDLMTEETDDLKRLAFSEFALAEPKPEARRSGTRTRRRTRRY